MQLNQSIECPSEALLWGLMSLPALISYGFEPAVNAQFSSCLMVWYSARFSCNFIKMWAHYSFNQFRTDGDVIALVLHKAGPSVRLVSLTSFENKTSADTFYHSLLLPSYCCWVASVRTLKVDPPKRKVISQQLANKKSFTTGWNEATHSEIP